MGTSLSSLGQNDDSTSHAFAIVSSFVTQIVLAITQIVDTGMNGHGAANDGSFSRQGK